MSAAEKLLARLPDAKPSGKGWSARCPAHEDRRASLSVSEGENGGAVVFCHAGCTAEAVCEALGLTLADLMPEDPSTLSTSMQSHKTRGKGEYRRRRQCRQSNGQVFATAREAVAALEKKHGPRSAFWTYHDASGEPVGLVVRWDTPEGKDIRPVSRNGSGWQVAGMAEPRPLYRLTDLAHARRVYVVEGEKAADAARSIGLVCTTSPHGAESAGKADWSPLVGRDVVILPDHDDAGRKYAGAVAGILGRLDPPATVRVVELPGLPEGGDLFDFVEQHDAVESETLAQRINDLADEAPAWEPEKPEGDGLAWRPFPVEVLPEPARGFVVAASKALGCDSSYVALPLLVALGAAIGNTRRLRVKRAWEVPPILWGAIVGESGTTKSPAFRLVLRPIRVWQQKALEAHATAAKAHEEDMAHYEKALTAWKRDRKTIEPPPEKPEAPRAERYVVSDTTTEALAPILLDNPRGVLLARDELAGWIGSFDRYAGGKGGGDSAHWLSMYSAENIVVDRKTGTPRTLFVPRAAVCVLGGVQPGILHRALGAEHRESGLAARLLLTCPPRKPKRWTEADVDEATERQLAEVFARLYGLESATDEEGRPEPVVVHLAPEAKRLWVAFYNAHAQEQVVLSGDMAAAWSKLEETGARLALIVHFTRWAAADPSLESADVLDAESMAAGIELVGWAKGEAQRVYGLLGETEEERDRRDLAEWIRRKGGSVTARELQQGQRRFRTADEAEEALAELVKAGRGQWEPSPPGQRGQPTRRFRLSTVSTSTEIP